MVEQWLRRARRSSGGHDGRQLPSVIKSTPIRHYSFDDATARSIREAAMKLHILPLKSEPQVVGGLPDPMKDQLANASKVVLPPSIKASHTYRCKDNSLVYVDFMSNDVSANIRTKEGGPPTPLTAAAKGDPFKADGYAVVGSGTEVSITVPGKGSQICSS
jgi:hypothetical protein